MSRVSKSLVYEKGQLGEHLTNPVAYKEKFERIEKLRKKIEEIQKVKISPKINIRKHDGNRDLRWKQKSKERQIDIENNVLLQKIAEINQVSSSKNSVLGFSPNSQYGLHIIPYVKSLNAISRIQKAKQIS